MCCLACGRQKAYEQRNELGQECHVMVNGSERVSPIFIVHDLGFKSRPGIRVHNFRSCDVVKLSARPAIFLSSSKINHNLKKEKIFVGHRTHFAHFLFPGDNGHGIKAGEREVVWENAFHDVFRHLFMCEGKKTLFSLILLPQFFIPRL